MKIEQWHHDLQFVGYLVTDRVQQQLDYTIFNNEEVISGGSMTVEGMTADQISNAIWDILNEIQGENQ